MKKTIAVILLLCTLAVLLSSCGGSSILKKTPQYIGQRSVDWVDAEKGWRVFWAFYEKENSQEELKADATILVSIKDENGNVLLDKQYEVTESDYGRWSNAISGEHILGSVFIPISDLEKGTSEYGYLSLGASVGGGEFDPVDLSVYNLPLMDMDIDIPELPLTVTEYDYYDAPEKTIQINKVDVEYDYGCELSVTFTLLDHKDGSNVEDYCEFSYRITDDDGLVVTSGNIFSNKIRVGDTTKEEIYAYDLELGKHYTLEFSDYHS